MVEDSESDKSREPEQHGQGIETKEDDPVGDRREEFRGEAQVEDDEEGPDGDEDEEGILGGGVAVACDCGWV